LPVPKFTFPVVPESSVRSLAPVEAIVPALAKVKAVGETEIVLIVATPVSPPAVVTLSPPLEVKAKVPVELPSVSDPDPVAKLVSPVELKVVKLAVDGVVVPMAVLLMPLSVVLKFAELIRRFPEVIDKLFMPVSIDDALRPERAREPDVAVKLKAPVV